VTEPLPMIGRDDAAALMPEQVNTSMGRAHAGSRAHVAVTRRAT
jgi:hypothetical protein